jgi:transcriptional regulator with PAS, ATPase and Fis domain/tetratricopeptide (TPR) repeat protein
VQFLAEAQRLVHEGDFMAALKVLDGFTASGETRVEGQVLKAEVLERLGRSTQSRAIASSIVKTTRNLASTHRAACEYILGKIAREEGHTDEAIERFQKAASLAERANDLRRFCWAEISLLLLVSQRSGPDAAAPILSRLRLATTKLGDPQTTAALHIYVGEMETKRGLLQSAEQHTLLALQLIQTSPNMWLESVAENTRLAVAILRSDFSEALSHGQRALEIAYRANASATIRACLGNLGNVCFAVGEFDRAISYFEQALAVLPSEGENSNANLDSLARIRLTQNRLDDCGLLLDRIDTAIRSDSDRLLYAHRHAELTRARLLARRGRTVDALVQLDFVLELATRTGDQLLSRTTLLQKAELLLQSQRVPEALVALNEVVSSVTSSPPDVYAEYERLLACALLEQGHRAESQHHRIRAQRIFRQLRDVPALLELERSWSHAAAKADKSDLATQELVPRSSITAVFQGLATTLLCHEQLNFAACELVHVLFATGSIYAATAVARRGDGSEQVLAHVGMEDSTPSGSAERRFHIGSAQEQTIEVVVQGKPDIESVATVHSAILVASALVELERSRAVGRERAALWPVEALPIESDDAVVTGHMREQMSFAQRIAHTTVNVLITGESGTGKEILARAIHNFSDRAQKPFVPFNCTAVPRDLLESQLFGHRRGAFTGADRDFPGLIRSARDGTLFLDEVGELGLDLQPKLLRFLESGEISPLGEPASLTVNVRIVAATNANLEDAVRDGRFREDLFYRLNVVRLTVKPLRERRDEIPTLVQHFVARAAHEFGKGYMQLAEETMERLILYRWPGNVRQLQNEMRRMVALAHPNSTLPPDAISEDILASLPIVRHAGKRREFAVPLHDKLQPTLSRIETEMIKAALRDHHGKVDAVAKALGISRKGLYLKRQRLGL